MSSLLEGCNPSCPIPDSAEERRRIDDEYTRPEGTAKGKRNLTCLGSQADGRARGREISSRYDRGWPSVERLTRLDRSDIPCRHLVVLNKLKIRSRRQQSRPDLLHRLSRANDVSHLDISHFLRQSVAGRKLFVLVDDLGVLRFAFGLRESRSISFLLWRKDGTQSISIIAATCAIGKESDKCGRTFFLGTDAFLAAGFAFFSLTSSSSSSSSSSLAAFLEVDALVFFAGGAAAGSTEGKSSCDDSPRELEGEGAGGAALRLEAMITSRRKGL